MRAEWLARIEQVYTVITSVVTVFTMVVISADVFCRYVLNSPLDWSYELIGQYCLALMMYGPMSDLFRQRKHLNVDLFVRHLRPAIAARLEVALELLLLPVLGLLLWLVASTGLQAFLDNEVIASGPYLWPNWIVPAIASLSIGLLITRCVLNILVPGCREEKRAPSHVSHE